MDREISPPPSKRRKLECSLVEAQTTIQDGPALISTPGTNYIPPSPSPNPDTLRIFAWNINGITPFLHSSKPITSYFSPTKKRSSSFRSNDAATSPPPASLRAFLHRHNWPHALLLQEVKVAHDDTKTQRAVQAAINAKLSADDKGPPYKAFFSLPTDKHNARGLGGKGRVYGVCSILRADFCEDEVRRVRDVEWDREGRVSVVELKSKVAVWNIYAVNGTENAYRDPMTGAVEGTRHDRKLAFHGLLVGECRRMEAQGWRHVLLGDFNVAPRRKDGWPGLRTWPPQHVINRADFNARFFGVGMGVEEGKESLGAVDVWRKIKGTEQRYTYHPRGVKWGASCDRVDLVVASGGLVEERRMVDVGILDSEKERGPSDHVPIWVELKVERKRAEGVSGGDEREEIAEDAYEIKK
ncbi:hypothetical protein LTS18_010648 [Coniosporium uncinatum]|uniref:Uncharacterized protein n=1 Tax=Coniosporium uncinatum TaxID=93489 RepID=A0ACC3DZI9_9PEZI|nr:hypothetical protein LTS18_010648 [Coniosporium uncinatum]